jgi:mRNA interferase MazF
MPKVYHSGEVVFLMFPFVEASGAKRRPALVLMDASDDDIIVARITGQMSQTAFDVPLVEWQQAGLRIPSVVRVHKLATLEKGLVERQLGNLAPDDWAQVRARLQQLWASV